MSANNSSTENLKVETMRPRLTTEGGLRPAGLSDDEYAKWWLAHQDAVARHASMAAYKYAPERIGRAIASVGARVEQMSRDLASKFPKSSPFYREPWTGDWRGVDLKGWRRAEDENLRRELQRRIEIAKAKGVAL